MYLHVPDCRAISVFPTIPFDSHYVPVLLECDIEYLKRRWSPDGSFPHIIQAIADVERSHHGDGDVRR